MPPKGKSKNYKGRSRHFTSPEEVEAQQAKEEKERAWRERRNVADEDEDEESENESDEDSSDGSSVEEGEEKRKGVEGLIEIENPNRAAQKSKKTADETSGAAPEPEKAPELSRREREEIQKQKARAHYEKLHAAGRTDQARADLARLAIIRKQREEQARKKAEEKRLAEQKAAAVKK